VAAVAAGAVFGDAVAHVFRIAGIDGGDHGHGDSGGAAEQFADGQADRFAEKVPAGDVERCFGVIVSDEGVVHQVMDPVDLARVAAQEGRGQFGDAGPGA
jgi:hypothetical protein